MLLSANIFLWNIILESTVNNFDYKNAFYVSNSANLLNLFIIAYKNQKGILKCLIIIGHGIYMISQEGREKKCFQT